MLSSQVEAILVASPLHTTIALAKFLTFALVIHQSSPCLPFWFPVSCRSGTFMSRCGPLMTLCFQPIYSLYSHSHCCNDSRPKRPSSPSEHWPRPKSKIALCHTGSVSVQTIPSSGTPSAVTGVAPSWDCKQLTN